MLSSDYEDLFSTFNAHKIKYLVGGAHAELIEAKQAARRPQDKLGLEKIAEQDTPKMLRQITGAS